MTVKHHRIDSIEKDEGRKWKDIKDSPRLVRQCCWKTAFFKKLRMKKQVYKGVHP